MLDRKLAFTGFLAGAVAAGLSPHVVFAQVSVKCRAGVSASKVSRVVVRQNAAQNSSLVWTVGQVTYDCGSDAPPGKTGSNCGVCDHMTVTYTNDLMNQPATRDGGVIMGPSAVACNSKGNVAPFTNKAAAIRNGVNTVLVFTHSFAGHSYGVNNTEVCPDLQQNANAYGNACTIEVEVP